jgi:phosphatidylglycerol:prolipoprotein diacylglycerol transferase
LAARPAAAEDRAAEAGPHPEGCLDSDDDALRGRRGRRAETLSTLLDRLAERVILFRIGDLVFVTFGLFAALGALATLVGSGVVLIGQGLAAEVFLAFGLVSCVAVVVGSWLVAQLFDYRLLLANPREALRRPVFVSWGGILFLPPVFLLFSWFTGFGTWLFLDAVARVIPLGHALGRLGCLSYGCCFGRPTDRRLAITYRNPLAKAVRVAGLEGVRLHPTALYEAVMDMGIFLLLNLAAVVDAPVGTPAALALLLYGLGRFGIEFVKDNHGRIIIGRLAVNHLVCLALIAVGVFLLRGVLQTPETAPAISWSLGFDTVWDLLPAIAPAALVVFVGFSLHRRRIGAW